jgi:hypothetical protein
MSPTKFETDLKDIQDKGYETVFHMKYMTNLVEILNKKRNMSF